MAICRTDDGQVLTMQEARSLSKLNQQEAATAQVVTPPISPSKQSPSASRKRSREEDVHEEEGGDHDMSMDSESTAFSSYPGYQPTSQNYPARLSGQHRRMSEQAAGTHTVRPTLRNCKSQRLDGVARGIITPSPSTPMSMAGSPNLPSPRQGPVIDDFTVRLGIGWRRIHDQPHIQAAARGWAKYIENHYPGLTNVSIRLESQGLLSYLVQTDQGYYLFAENLRQGRLVSRTDEGCMRNLQQSPPTFEGSEVLVAGTSSAVNHSAVNHSAANHRNNGVDMVVGDVEMEVC